MTNNPARPPDPPAFLPGKPWPGAAAATCGILYHHRTPGGVWLAFLLKRERIPNTNPAAYGERLATGYTLTTPPQFFEGFTIKQLVAFAAKFKTEAQT